MVLSHISNGCIHTHIYINVQELHELRKKISGAVNCSIAAYDDR